jgi:predicted SAM-dependent methyltransferase
MSYSLPFRAGQKLIELGGGNRPLIRPNVDIRPGPTVDIVADLGKPLPLESETYDGVYSQYALEHISWREVRGFLKETYRVLRPGGRAVFVTANLLEQAKRLVQRDEEGWEDTDVCMVFGDLDYPENSHKCGFSPEFAFRLFREAGFQDVLIVPHGEFKTDMIVEAKKAEPEIKPHLWTPQERKQAYNRHYFDGGRGTVGGYARGGYADFQVHWKTFEEVMKRKPGSVLELGSARGYILKRLEDAGVRVRGLEVSDHCYLTRVVEDIRIWDITQTPWPVGDKEFDLCFSIATLEHIPEEKIEVVAAEMERTCKRGLHGIDFGEHDDGFDKTHCTFKPKEWWEKVLPAGHEVVDKEDLERPPIPIPQGDGKLKLNVGSFTTMFHHGWVNVDIHDLDRWAKQNGYIYRKIDVTKGLPWETDCVDLIYACHFLEHLNYHDGMSFLREVYRVMKPGGVFRLILPDAEKLISEYQKGKLGQYDEVNDGCANSVAQIAKLWSLLFAGHNSMYDEETIHDTLEWAGFKKIERMAFRRSLSPQMLRETLDMFPDLSLFVDAVK